MFVSSSASISLPVITITGFSSIIIQVTSHCPVPGL